MEIKFKLIEKTNLTIILPLLHELDPVISEIALKARLREMIEKGYECVGIYNEDELIGLCGIWTLVKYYVGRHIELDNVYIKKKYRNSGIGKQLDAWLKDFALSRGCEAIELNCYVNNEKGKHFWESNDYSLIGLHYQKKLGIRK
jgi:GNAT superfamily N-acetyltransferase